MKGKILIFLRLSWFWAYFQRLIRYVMLITRSSAKSHPRLPFNPLPSFVVWPHSEEFLV